MTRSCLALLVMTLTAGLVRPAVVPAQEAPPLAGRWSLNRELSQFPREIGFAEDFSTASRVSREDSARRQLLTAEVRDPAPQLTIVETEAGVTITPGNGAPRTFHPSGKAEAFQAGDVSLTATASREGGRLVVLYKVEPGRELRYTYSRIASPPQLMVEVQFLERGTGDIVRRIYEPAREAATPAAARPGAATAPAGRASTQDFDQRPDAHLRGLTKLGVVVEGLGPQAQACGLRQDAIESAVTKQLSGAGLQVALNTDNDTYVYVNVMTATLQSGLCISRYDVSIYTHTTASLEYHAAPVLVDVSLMRKGSLAAGASASHADSVLKGVQEYVGQFAARIRDANQ